LTCRTGLGQKFDKMQTRLTAAAGGGGKYFFFRRLFPFDVG
jgi:hypothetical protein